MIISRDQYPLAALRKVENCTPEVVKTMSAIQCFFWSNDDLCGARDHSKLCDPAVSMPLASLDPDVTHCLVKVDAGSTKASASNRLQHFPEYKVILNQTGR